MMQDMNLGYGGVGRQVKEDYVPAGTKLRPKSGEKGMGDIL